MLMTEEAVMTRAAAPLGGVMPSQIDYDGVKRMVGERIRMLRDAKQMSQAELARLLDKSRSAVAQWEVGNALPDIMDFHRVARFLDSTPQFITFGISDNNQGVSVSMMDYTESATGTQTGYMALSDDYVAAFVRGTAQRLKGVSVTDQLPFEGVPNHSVIIIDESQRRILGQGESFLMFERLPGFVKVANIPGQPDKVQITLARGQSVSVARSVLSIIGKVVGVLRPPM